ncbi:MAG TPA: GNAT family N-acetyltransferase [Steroidobacteraceae bacterium]|nr:GNAT family N-acetyltransferase [Steroidobacteraceae bacterium]
MTTNIRPATPADVPQILRFIRALGEYEHLAHDISATEQALTATLFGAKRYAEVVLADCDGQPAGFALYFHNYSTFLAQPGIYLEDLFVDPPYRGRGVGKTLLKELARIAVDRGCARLDWSALDWNRTAIDFYLRLGAVELNGWSLYRLAGEALRRMASQ